MNRFLTMKSITPGRKTLLGFIIFVWLFMPPGGICALTLAVLGIAFFATPIRAALIKRYRPTAPKATTKPKGRPAPASASTHDDFIDTYEGSDGVFHPVDY
jgi:hypothetical protein